MTQDKTWKNLKEIQVHGISRIILWTKMVWFQQEGSSVLKSFREKQPSPVSLPCHRMTPKVQLSMVRWDLGPSGSLSSWASPEATALSGLRFYLASLAAVHLTMLNAFSTPELILFKCFIYMFLLESHFPYIAQVSLKHFLWARFCILMFSQTLQSQNQNGSV